jgi:hypothetical protein
MLLFSDCVRMQLLLLLLPLLVGCALARPQPEDLLPPLTSYLTCGKLYYRYILYYRYKLYYMYKLL